MTDTSLDMARSGDGAGARLKAMIFHEFSWIWGGTIALFIVCFFVAPGVVRPAAINTMLPFAAILAIAAVGMTIVIQLVYPEAFFWTHASWFAVLILVLLVGPGRISLDWLATRLLGSARRAMA